MEEAQRICDSSPPMPNSEGPLFIRTSIKNAILMLAVEKQSWIHIPIRFQQMHTGIRKIQWLIFATGSIVPMQEEPSLPMSNFGYAPSSWLTRVFAKSYLRAFDLIIICFFFGRLLFKTMPLVSFFAQEFLSRFINS